MTAKLPEQPSLCPECLTHALTAVQGVRGGVLWLEYCTHRAGGTLARVQAFDGEVVQMVLSAPTSPQEAAREAGLHRERYGNPIASGGGTLN